MEIEINSIKKFMGIFVLSLSIVIIITLDIIVVVKSTNILITSFFIIITLGGYLFNIRIRNKRIYVLMRLGTFVPLFKESAIRITNEYITVKIEEEPSFFIWWKNFDIIKISRKTKKWKLIQTLSFKKYKIQFYTYYPNYKKTFKYISSFELSTKHFSLLKIEEIITSLKKFSNFLNKEYYNEMS